MRRTGAKTVNSLKLPPKAKGYSTAYFLQIANWNIPMKKLTDYIFYESWQTKELNLKDGKKYKALTNIGDIKAGEFVTLAGFDDVDNHYGILVFKNTIEEVLEIRGDYSGKDHPIFAKIRAALVEA